MALRVGKDCGGQEGSMKWREGGHQHLPLGIGHGWACLLFYLEPTILLTYS